MCNRYANIGSVSEIRRLAALMDYDLATTPATDNYGGQANIYPDQDAPIIRPAGKGKLELAMARWGFPPSPSKPGEPKRKPIANIRTLDPANPKSRWWRHANKEFLFEPEYRCLVPFTAFAEPVRDSTWFTVKGVDVSCFAGVWRPWHGERLAEQPGKKRRAREEGDWELYAFLTTEANDIVRPVHEKAMPVVLTDPVEQKEWLSGGEESLALQRPYEASAMEIVEA